MLRNQAFNTYGHGKFIVWVRANLNIINQCGELQKGGNQIFKVQLGGGRLKLSEGKNLEGNFEISICKVLVLIKVVSGKNNYFLHQKFELHR